MHKFNFHPCARKHKTQCHIWKGYNADPVLRRQAIHKKWICFNGNKIPSVCPQILRGVGCPRGVSDVLPDGSVVYCEHFDLSIINTDTAIGKMEVIVPCELCHQTAIVASEISEATKDSIQDAKEKGILSDMQKAMLQEFEVVDEQGGIDRSPPKKK